MQVMNLMLKLLGALVIAMTISACSSSVQDFDVTVQLDETLRNQYGLMPSFEVDVIAINTDQEERIKNYDIDEYFAYRNPMRMSLTKRTLKFSEDSAVTQTIDSSDPIWEEWASNNAEILVLIANLPYSHAGSSGNDNTDNASVDGRRLLVPMQREHWYSLPKWSLFFLITPTGLVQLDKLKESENLIDSLNSIKESDAIQNAVKAVDTANQLKDTADNVAQGIKALK